MTSTGFDQQIQVALSTLARQGTVDHHFISRLIIDWQTASAPRSAALNRRYRGKAQPTDVLSFPLYSYQELRSKNLPRRQAGQELRQREPILLGSLVLCPAVIRERAKETGLKYQDQLYWTIDHGLRHLLGYDHTPSGRRWFPSEPVAQVRSLTPQEGRRQLLSSVEL